MRKVIITMVLSVFAVGGLYAQGQSTGNAQNGNSLIAHGAQNGKVVEYDQMTGKGKLRSYDTGVEHEFENRNNVNIAIGDDVIYITITNPKKVFVVVRKN